jgi:hypothetical protein
MDASTEEIGKKLDIRGFKASREAGNVFILRRNLQQKNRCSRL